MQFDRGTGYTRRQFMKNAALLAAAALPFGSRLRGAVKSADTDRDILAQKFQFAVDKSLRAVPIGDVMAAMGASFVGTPYVAHTLEQPGPEHLVINLHGLDCTTFVENMLALSRCIKLHQTAYDDFTKQLQLIRYRSGVIEGYPSRLHYFTDWIGDNERKGIVHDTTRELGGIPLIKTYDFMSTHVKSYPQLSDKSALDAVRAAEVRLTSTTHTYIPNNKVAGMQDKLRSGDIIAIATSIPGIDVSHTGMVAVKDGTPYYLHAPLSGGSVQFSQGSLAEYLARAGKHIGIIIARPLEPAAR